MEIQSGYLIAGLVVGFIVGLTGVGGGSLMTPILIHLGVPPLHAVGTDLLYAATTKAGGIHIHHARGNIDWRLTGTLSAGSVPAALCVLWIIHTVHYESYASDRFITAMLGIALMLTAIAIICKGTLLKYSQKNNFWLTRLSPSQQTGATIIVGIILGTLVSITSIGAGALGTIALFLLYPLMPTVKLVGTEIAHAVPLTLVAGIGHAGSGHVDVGLLVNLLFGSLPGIYVGCKLANTVHDQYLRPVLATMLFIVGSRLMM